MAIRLRDVFEKAADARLLKILVTGAAGLIGSELCAWLVARGHEVTALVHRRSDVRANDGTLVSSLKIVRGDISRPGFGLEEPLSRLDLVVHCAARLEFDAPVQDLAATNVEGTRNAAAFAQSAGARLLHVSTAYVCGVRDGPVAEAQVPPGTVFANGYEASKAAAEEIVRSSGVPFAIARPSIVLGSSSEGTIREFPAICNLFRLMARGTIRGLPIAAEATLDLVPIDFVAQGLVLLAERMDRAEGRHLHLASGDPLPARKLVEALARHPHFAQAKVVEPQAFEPAELTGSERRVLDHVLASYGSYLRHDPRFETAAFRALTGLACPAPDDAWLDRLIDYAIARGYLPAPEAAALAPQRISG